MTKNAVRPIVTEKLEKSPFDIDIYDVQMFSSLIRHERCRADRSGRTFALIVFAFDENPVSSARVKSVCAQLSQAMRSIDEIGWLEHGRIGVLLPATMREGAHQYARRASAGNPYLSYEVFVYPDHWMSDYSEKKDDCDKGVAPGLDISDAFCIDVPAWKRGLDIVGSFMGILVLWPLFMLIAAYIKIVSPGPAFFRQKRVGRGGKLFTLMKFRTMKQGNDQGAHQEHIVKRIRAGQALAKLDDKDPRIIPGGRILRRACVDELPQLFNILRGDMSLVGPRPCVPYEAREFLMWHTHRFDSMPGLTGLWQVSGKNKLTFAQMIRLDIAYTSHISLVNDLAIIARTIPAIIVMIAESLAKKMPKANKLNEGVSLVEEPMQKQAVLSTAWYRGSPPSYY
jgi:lipopolysaccharide/colanic/teichoic acid biosynthesis glycosyltransferase